jgi:hypothetical protein
MDVETHQAVFQRVLQLLAEKKLLAWKADKTQDQCRDLIRGRVQCEMTGVKNVNLSVRHVLAIAFRLAGIE